MKRNLLYVLTVLVIASSCSTKPEEIIQVPKLAKLTGKILNQFDSIMVITKDEEQDSVRLDSNGNFYWEKVLTEPATYRFYQGVSSGTLYLRPGDSISISVDCEDFNESLSFTGIGAEVNNYFAENVRIQFQFQAKYAYAELFSKEENEFVSILDSFRDVLDNQLVKFENSVVQEYQDVIKDEKITNLYRHSIYLLRWPSSNGQYADYADYEDIELSKNYYEFLKKIDINDTTLLENNMYISFLSSYLDYKIGELLTADTTLSELKAKVDVTLSDFKSAKNRERVLYSTLKEQLSYRGIDGVDEVLPIFKSNCKYTEYLTTIDSLYQVWEALNKGKIAPVFSYPDIKGDSVSLKDFLGKYVYIDVWATWCGPCMEELPYLENLQVHFKNNNIAFVSVSVDTDMERWENVVLDRELGGSQLYANGWDTPVAKDYLIKSIPRFLLIDRAGRIINANASRPSEDILEIIEALEGI